MLLKLCCLLLLSFLTAFVSNASPITYPKIDIQKDWIPMRDGIRLSVTLYRPLFERGDEKLPVLLEYLPYRKDDAFAARDYEIHTYFAHRGYVTARVDIRGTGTSEGVLPFREYSEQEQRDGLEIIEWLASQTWSNGKVGMFGISWGGFNSIQMAMRRPPALKAILAVDASDRLFKDDIHYIDGLVHVDAYTLSMDLFSTKSRAPDFPLDEKTLQERFDIKPWSLEYLEHQRDGIFWDQGSLSSDYSTIQIPSFLIGGFYDGYRDSIPRMLANVKSPVKAIVGPWNHTMPHNADPGPTIEWRHEALRWWDYWLKGQETGIMNEPRVAVYMRDWYKPDLHLQIIPGKWRNEEAWPPKDLKSQTLFMSHPHKLAAKESAPSIDSLEYLPSSGIEAGLWWGDLTGDQKNYDAKSLVYDSESLETEIAILGFPELELHVAASAKQANWFVRLSDLSPDGDVTLITGAGANSSQRNSSRNPTYTKAGQIYSLTIPLHFTSWKFPKGHKVRIAISNALWPMIFPSPEAMHTSVFLGRGFSSKISLPVVPINNNSIPHFLDTEPSDSHPEIRSDDALWPGTWQIDKKEGLTKVLWRGKSLNEFPWGSEKNSDQLSYSIDDRTLFSSVRGDAETEVHLKDGVIKWLAKLEFSGDKENFFYRLTRRLLKDKLLIRERTWEATVPRDHQ